VTGASSIGGLEVLSEILQKNQSLNRRFPDRQPGSFSLGTKKMNQKKLSPAVGISGAGDFDVGGRWWR
jgi:hypothetical protein